MRPATSTFYLLDGAATALAGSTVLPEDLEVISEVAILTTGVFEMLEGGTTNSDGFLHDVSGGRAERGRLFLGHAVSSPGWSDTCSPQCFVDINIAEASDE